MKFCRFWRMTPREVDALHPDEYVAMTKAANREIAEAKRQARKRK